MVQNRDLDLTEQLSLLSPDELRGMQRLVPRSQEGEIMARKAPCRDGEEHVVQENSYIQDVLPGLG